MYETETTHLLAVNDTDAVGYGMKRNYSNDIRRRIVVITRHSTLQDARFINGKLQIAWQ